MSTHTYSILAVSPRAFGELSARMKAAGQDQAFHDDAREHGTVIDMHGVAIARLNGAAGADIEPGVRIQVGSILSQRTKTGMVEMSLNDETTQMDLDKAREVVRMLQGAIEAATSDQLLFAFLTTKVGLPPEAASAALLDFRELRQGSKSVVHPS
jgi:hypothetical protein